MSSLFCLLCCVLNPCVSSYSVRCAVLLFVVFRVLTRRLQAQEVIGGDLITMGEVETASARPLPGQFQEGLLCAVFCVLYGVL